MTHGAEASRGDRGSGRDDASGLQSRRIAYADPPYPGLARRYYREHRDFGGEVDHAALIRRLSTYDGWALSTSAAALPAVLSSCAAAGVRVRVAAWVRGERPTRSAWPLHAWEPVIYVPARPLFASWRDVDSRRVDALVYVARARTTDPTRVVGSKPAAFARWLFASLLAAVPGDAFEDLFPGSGGIGRAWSIYSSRRDLVAPDVSRDTSLRTSATG